MLQQYSLLVPFLLTTLAAQTFVVDVANGPGAHFTSLGAALAAVPDGAVLQVRPGAYHEPLAISGKGVTILAAPLAEVVIPATALSVVTIDNLAPHQTVVLRGLSVRPASYGVIPIQCTNNQGLVVLDRVEGNSHRSLSTSHCARVVVRSCWLVGLQTVLRNSSVAFEGCTVGGTMRIEQSDVQFLAGTVEGSPVWPVPSPAIELVGGNLRALGGAVVRGGRSPMPGGAMAQAIVGTGSARLDPSVLVSGANPPIGMTVVATTVAMPHVTLLDAPLGGTLTASLRGPIGHLCMLAVGLPAPNYTVPGIADPFWWDPASVVTQAMGVPAVGLPVVGITPVPNWSGLLGLQLVWQGLSYHSAVGLQASNPMHHVVR